MSENSGHPLSGRGWNVDTVLALLNERDKRYEQQFRSQEEAVKIAEANAEKWRANANEWRNAMNDRERQFQTRAEMEATVSSIEKSIYELKERLDRMEGAHRGLGQGWGYLIGAIGLIVMLSSIFMNFKGP